MAHNYFYADSPRPQVEKLIGAIARQDSHLRHLLLQGFLVNFQIFSRRIYARMPQNVRQIGELISAIEESPREIMPQTMRKNFRNVHAPGTRGGFHLLRNIRAANRLSRRT